MIGHVLGVLIIASAGGLTPEEDKPDLRGPIQRHPFDPPGTPVPFPKDEAIHACHARAMYEIQVKRGQDMEPLSYHAERFGALFWHVQGAFARPGDSEQRGPDILMIECEVDSEGVLSFAILAK